MCSFKKLKPNKYLGSCFLRMCWKRLNIVWDRWGRSRVNGQPAGDIFDFPSARIADSGEVQSFYCGIFECNMLAIEVCTVSLILSLSFSQAEARHCEGKLGAREREGQR